jgi:hypothetical protein
MNREQWMKFFTVLFVLFFMNMYNKRKDVGTNVAKKGQYSKLNNYQNILSVQNDVFKRYSMDLVALFIVGYSTSDDLFSIENFEKSAIGRTILASIGLVAYSEIIQPYIINYL